ncbi:MAG TPA: zf-HC2 domain-containing protein [Phycisphaerae bacterium]|nr:zf-HC2 domain-containing protein [Phycisphaerae bacterium]
MNCRDYEPMLAAYVDGELSEQDRGRLQEHLSGCLGCTDRLAELTALQEELAMIKFTEPTDVDLQRYWAGVYNRLERGVGWILLSVGSILLLCYGAFKLIEGIVTDPKVALVVKIGVVALVFGVVILFVSLLRERLAVRKSDKYSREIER